eukprot:TRINITY_DN4185_c0_g1_i2.p1 TRINITY_DN4185_c0_g1~~TRINITY_DN4185_c0_g1_i2.p1  ORF type:complete len:232 (-),score=46.04 TRINITY_DN4185_c0_g1_i2:680-1327(-)
MEHELGYKVHDETLILHADHHCEHGYLDMAPPIHVATTFEHGSEYAYARSTQPTRTRVELVLGKLEGGYAVTYGSGLAAMNAVINTVKPKTIALQDGYSGTMHVLENYRHLLDGNVNIVGIEEVGQNEDIDLILIESFSNPLMESVDIGNLASVKPFNCTLVVDSTFASPIVCKPLELGADIVLHSATKFLSGHHDVMGGVVICKESGIQFILQD